MTHIHYILLDARYDAEQANLCECSACCDAYIAAYRVAMERVAMARELDVEVIVGSYRFDGSDGSDHDDRDCDDRECEGACRGMWQEAHDAAEWRQVCASPRP